MALECYSCNSHRDQGCPNNNASYIVECPFVPDLKDSSLTAVCAKELAQVVDYHIYIVDGVETKKSTDDS
jgi:hypothetical protein